MRPTNVLAPVLVLLALAATSAGFAGLPADAAFERLKGLVGAWKADVGGHTVTLAYRLVSSDSALVETYTTASGRETLTIYHRDGAKLLATHYCAQGNQPRLALDPAAGSDGELVFAFQDVTNLREPTASHLVRMRYAFTDADHVTLSETYAGQREETTAYALVRQK